MDPRPTVRVLSQEPIQQLQGLQQFFPLPPVVFDLNTKRLSGN
jgi:hypothetical protein